MRRREVTRGTLYEYDVENVRSASDGCVTDDWRECLPPLARASRPAALTVRSAFDMNATPTYSAWFWPVVLMAVLLLGYGFYLTRTGFAGRRRGDVPHCAGCDYIVGGLDVARCPECGADLNAPGAVVRGERHRRRGRGLAGLLLALVGLGLGVAALTPGVRRIDWYPYRPAGWVIRDFKSTNPARSDRAWAELSRRISAEGLSDARRSEVVGLVLDRYAADPLAIAARPVAMVTADRARLSPGQQGRLFAALLAGVRSPARNAARGARDVLDVMRAGGELDDGRHGRLTELALAEQAAATPAPEGRWLLTYLGDRELAGALTDEQRGRFYRQAYSAGPLLVRKTCVEGDPIVYRYTVGGRGPENDSGTPVRHVWWVLSRTGRVRVDGKARTEGGGSMSSSSFGHGTGGSSVDDVGPGRHTLEVVLTLAVYHGPPGEVHHDRQAEPRWTKTVTLADEFEVLPEATPGLLRWVDDPSAAAAIKAAIKPRDVRRRRRAGSGPGIDMMFEVDEPPVNVAFDVIARVGGKEYPIGTLVKLAGATVHTGFSSMEFPASEADKIDLILRSSDKAMRNTVDLYQAWQGEIVYENITVQSGSP